MARETVVLITGPGGQGRVVLDTLCATDVNVLGVLDPELDGDCNGIPVLGKVEAWPKFVATASFVLANSNPEARLALAQSVNAGGGRFFPAIHPGASVSPSVRLGRGVVLLNGANIHANADIGDHCIVNAMTSLDHDVMLAEGVQVGPGVIFPGGVRCGRLANIGAGAVALPGIEIGERAIVGAGAVVTKNVPAGATVAGNPARVLPAKS